MSLTYASVAAPSHSALQVVHRNGPCGGKSVSKLTQLEVLVQDSLRVASLQEKVSGVSRGNNTLLLGSQISIPARSGLYLGTGNYVITIGFGTPTKAQTVIFDTGSDVNWIQCKPCAVSCYSQQEPLFDPALSSTYRTFTCTAPACLRLGKGGCSGTTCVYGVTYGDGSSTLGFLARDTLTLTSTNVFSNFIFGCGQDNKGLFRGAAGLIGLGRSPYSLNSQVANSLGDIFSYCLPSTSSSTGYLNIGNPLGSTVFYTPMLTSSLAPSLYFIDLIGITVGRYSFHYSGTVITRLPPAAYSALRTVFRAAMTQYPLAQGNTLLDTCYDFSNLESITYPVIKLRYTDLEVTLTATGVFFVISSAQVCLAFAGNSDSTEIGIIGNVQQRAFEVTYDNIQKRIGFAVGTCS
ncbi:unnamed protein product [Spirodela intermedia]|uniref:Peptidase A1 domain-containing protein n=1 Tax=Spirodela intermedia TaxID=51605 RepID=A0A7I8JDS7_SPIIN|nr:unnamed protein product [Spirodela intermedia]CAA6668310.1 unnamed protein product [Spirodela intermedia]